VPAASEKPSSDSAELVGGIKGRLFTLRDCEAELDVKLSELQEAKKRLAMERT
jgi:hypothetical protein